MVPKRLEETINLLQELNDGDLHNLGDKILRERFTDLSRLIPHGINEEGKSIGGQPDSYVGNSPTSCTIGVQYTAKKAKLAAKLYDDYREARDISTFIRKVYLCTNRPIKKLNLSTLKAQARTDNIELVFIGGELLSQVLCDERQDLRNEYLRIAINAHTIESLIPCYS